MSRDAPRVHIDPAAIARLQEHVEQLPNGAHVSLLMDDGKEVRGIVAGRPMAQVFFSPDGTEGTNSVLRLEQSAMYHPEHAHIQDIWLDRVVLIRRLDPEKPESPD